MLFACSAAAKGPGGGLARGGLRGNRTAHFSLATKSQFHGVDGGVDRACRGDHAEDGEDTYYTVVEEVASLEECKSTCLGLPTCTGIEYSKSWGRCEVWSHSIGATAPARGFQCWRRGTAAARTTTPTTTIPAAGEPATDPRFSPADGGTGRACRGAHAQDSLDAYYELHEHILSFDACKALCTAAAACTGVEYNSAWARCEVWRRVVGTTAVVKGFECWRFESVTYLDMRKTHGPGSCVDAQGFFFDAWWGLGYARDMCAKACTRHAACLGFDFTPAADRCELRFSEGSLPDKDPGGFRGAWAGGRGVRPIEAVNKEDADRICFKKLQRTAATMPATAGPPAAFLRRPGGLVPVGGEVRLYAVGTSNAVWQTWVDQVHLLLRQLGYRTPAILARFAEALHPAVDPLCDDHTAYAALETPRVGRVGWASWGFAHESFEDCDTAGFRSVASHRVSCINTWACQTKGRNPQPEHLVRPSDVAEDAQHSTLTLVSTWMNDWKFRWRGNKCYDGKELTPAEVATVSLDGLLRLIRTIHAKNPAVIVVVLALYPGTNGVFVGEETLPWIATMNAAVRDGLAGEPNTIFANYSFPRSEEMYQTLMRGHLNCRGDKVIATSIVDTLFRKGVLSQGLDLGDPTACPPEAERNCSALSPRCCLRSPLCWPASDGSCAVYGPGQQNLY